MDNIVIDGEISLGQEIIGNTSVVQQIDGEVGRVIRYADVPTYYGEYTVTPSDVEQTLMTRELKMQDNVTINPIPSDYGHISWNGSVITVS